MTEFKSVSTLASEIGKSRNELKELVAKIIDDIRLLADCKTFSVQLDKADHRLDYAYPCITYIVVYDDGTTGTQLDLPTIRAELLPKVLPTLDVLVEQVTTYAIRQKEEAQAAVKKAEELRSRLLQAQA